MPRACPWRRRAAAVLTLAVLPAAAAAPARAEPIFVELDGALGPQPCPNGAGCWTSYVQLTDLDLDGDLDVIFPNAYGNSQPGIAQPLLVYTNAGDATFADVSASVVGGYTGWLRQVAVGDVDADGDPDLYAPSAWGDPDVFFINDGVGRFADEAAARLPNVRSHAGAARFGDVDADGDLDLLVTDGWATSAPEIAHLYLNDGAGAFVEAQPGTLPTSRQGDQPIDLDLLDLDGDFDLDLLVNMHTGLSSLWRNDGGVFTDVTRALPSQPGLHSGPSACDIDNDGDLDLLVDNAGPSFGEQVLVNDGAGAFTDTSVTAIIGNLTGIDDSGVVCVDVDGDGDLDAVVLSATADDRVLLNSGTGSFTLVEGSLSGPVDTTLGADVGDLDGDGRIDLITAQGKSGSFLDRVYLAADTVPSDTRPPRLRAVEVLGGAAPGEAAKVRFAVVDEATTDEGPRLHRAFVRVLLPGVEDVPATFMGGDLFRATLPPQEAGAEVSYAACAIDRRGNEACSQAVSFTVSDATGAGGSGGGGGPPGGGGGGGAVAEDANDSDEAGCFCAAAGAGEGEGGRGPVGITLALALALALAGRRVRPRARLGGRAS